MKKKIIAYYLTEIMGQLLITLKHIKKSSIHHKKMLKELDIMIKSCIIIGARTHLNDVFNSQIS